MCKKIRLNSRGGEENYLEQVKDTLYKLVTKRNYRVGFTDTNAEYLDFVDPSGGPFISKGFFVEGAGKVKSLKHIDGRGVFLEIEDDLSSNSKQGTV